MRRSASRLSVTSRMFAMPILSPSLSNTPLADASTIRQLPSDAAPEFDRHLGRFALQYAPIGALELRQIIRMHQLETRTPDALGIAVAQHALDGGTFILDGALGVDDDDDVAVVLHQPAEVSSRPQHAFVQRLALGNVIGHPDRLPASCASPTALRRDEPRTGSHPCA